MGKVAAYDLGKVAISPEQAREKERLRMRERTRQQGERARRKLLATHKEPPVVKEKGRARRKRQEARKR